jgi:hypothetical protein
MSTSMRDANALIFRRGIVTWQVITSRYSRLYGVTGKKTPGGARRYPALSPSVGFVAVPPRSLFRLKGRLRSPRSTQYQVLSTRSLGLLNFASEVGLSQHTV